MCFLSVKFLYISNGSCETCAENKNYTINVIIFTIIQETFVNLVGIGLHLLGKE